MHARMLTDIPSIQFRFRARSLNLGHHLEAATDVNTTLRASTATTTTASLSLLSSFFPPSSLTIVVIVSESPNRITSLTEIWPLDFQKRGTTEERKRKEKREREELVWLKVRLSHSRARTTCLLAFPSARRKEKRTNEPPT